MVKMSTFSGLEIGLSFLCGCVLLGCVSQVYYFLWWKKRNTIDIENKKSSSSSSCSPYYTLTTLSYISCWKNINSTKPTKTQENNQDPNTGLVQDQVFNDSEEESLDLELMRLHNLHGPPRFLTTINEETKEDLESQSSRKCSRTRSLSDLAAHFDTPQASPPIKGLHLINLESCQFHNNELNLNPLFENDVNIVKSSPPPTFKFLIDAEEKLLRRLMELEGEKKEVKKDGSFVKMTAGKNHVSTANSKVIPLASSPTNN
ncbi:uncharacterized protein [Rutidosis leptorrhynchoides]|uniref:uncharacterized protein n=1 Tax=Rutidosis leptorrhynchoides TaxID=125765 RepID=UPI003A99DBBF